MASSPKSASQPLEKVRQGCMKRGASGIKGLARTFRIFDDDRSRSLNISEFANGLKDYNIELSKEEVRQLFDEFDTDGSGNLNFDEFLVHLRPPMSETRVKLIKKAFSKIDRTGDGVITVEDLKGVYKVEHHPKYQSGEYTREQCLQEFLNSFQPQSSSPDEKVTYSEFLNYYAGVSASIDEDVYFDLMMRQAWKI